ncbi:hypothetical protein EWS92_22400 [Vibrio vulnificus]|uniref:hypothetical protein n=1 Tax=Vibrio vulnificus TaxID=672 RepID=UPI0018DB464A|nr:hypothetical protein [Vibrio vulnificus]EGR0790347.1 hypothetical protein [Vibrio vulnificus]EGR0799737.1 hypothetical protein [Vibrio vulnificus]EGR0817122.1 hypothetical protein [Vibrio vulnificus]EGR0829096.1 hypothetical protein [Vibrio vulnificus]EGR0849462.1 hypothetical protein [Vibrio vulnificus]
MSTFTRIAKNPVGMARLVTNYSRIKEMEAKGLSVEDIAEIFDENPKELKTFVEYSDAFVSGEKTLSLDVTTKSKDAFETVAASLK